MLDANACLLESVHVETSCTLENGRRNLDLSSAVQPNQSYNRSVNNQINMREGDWWCSKCNDKQFARNTNCRMCGVHRSEMEFGGAPEISAPLAWLDAGMDNQKKCFFCKEPGHFKKECQKYLASLPQWQ